MISKPTDYRILAVEPANHDIVGEEARYDVADYDLCIPPVFSTLVLFIKADHHIGEGKIVAAVKKGLAYALGQIPTFAGTIQFDSKSQRPYVSVSKNGTIALGIRHLNQNSSSFPSLEEWSKAGYANSELARHFKLLAPPGMESSDLPFGVRREAGCPMSAHQLNFIKGGFILLSGFHHWQGDAVTCDMFYKTWSRTAKACLNGTSIPSTVKASFDQSYFTKPKDTIGKERAEALLNKIIALRRVEMAKPQAAAAAATRSESGGSVQTALPQISHQTLHVSQENVNRLKQLCTSSSANRLVSSWDCLAALIWRAITRARRPMHLEWDTSTQITRLTSAVNVRGRVDVVPQEYIGNGWARSHTEPISMDTLLAEPVKSAAMLSRKATSNVRSTSIPEILELAKYAESNSGLQPDTSFHLGSDLLASSWVPIRVYDLDFGFGSIASFRGLAGALECMVLFPLDTGHGGNNGYDIGIQLEGSCLARLRQDEELLTFCELRPGQAARVKSKL